MRRRPSGLTLLAALALALDLVAAAGADVLVTGADVESAIATFADSASGSAPYVRRIVGGSTLLNVPGLIAVDLVHGEIYAPNCCVNMVTVHALTADGDIEPLRKLQGSNTGLDDTSSVALDLVHGELFVSNSFVDAPPNTGSITVYDLAAHDDAAPIRTIGPSAALQRAGGLFLDLVHDELFVTVPRPSPGPSFVLVFARTASGSDAPLRTLSGAQTLLAGPSGVFVGDGLLFVANRGANSVNVYRRDADLDEAPLRRIAGASTGLSLPQEVALNGDGQLLVANEGASNVTIYDVGDHDDTPARRTFTGPLGNLDVPAGLVTTKALGGATGHATSVLFSENFESDFSAGRTGFWRHVSPP